MSDEVIQQMYILQESRQNLILTLKLGRTQIDTLQEALNEAEMKIIQIDDIILNLK